MIGSIFCATLSTHLRSC